MTNKDKELDYEQRLFLQALYELSLEACGGDKKLMHSLPDDEHPKILMDDVEKRCDEIRRRKDQFSIKGDRFMDEVV